MGANLSAYDEVLKVYYLEGIQDYLNHGTPLADMIEVNEKDIAGKDANIEMHMSRNTGTGSRADGGVLPTAGNQGFTKATVPMKYQYGRVEFTGPTIAATRDNKGAYAQVINTEMTGIARDLMKEVNRQFWGCGYGILARWHSGTGANALVQNAYNGFTASQGGNGFGSTFGSKYVYDNGANSLVAMNNLSNASAGVFATITHVSNTSAGWSVTGSSTVTANTKTLTLADTGSPGLGDFLSRVNSVASVTASSAAGAARLEMMGLRGIVDERRPDQVACYTHTYVGQASSAAGLSVSDHLQSVNTATYPMFKAIVKAHPTGRYYAQRAVTFDLMQETFDAVEEIAGTGYGPDLIMTTRALRRKYLALCRADRRSVNTMTLDGGWKALDYNGVPLIVDTDAIDGEMYFLTLKDIQLYRMSDYDWMDRDGAILARVSGYDKYEAVLYRYAELGVTRRNTQAVLCDLSY